MVVCFEIYNSSQNSDGQSALTDSPVTACQQRKREEVVSKWKLKLPADGF